ncbi:MAG: LysR family transcriptional regulator [Methylomonas sp.]|nr:LysR family transcriptional regulator [Methylomonas sp.]PPD22625.1 MAG: LysR family transcriptional regulator [Methylomonas sp.]PPD27937.1 MAG: LysR family transcriptional regulator [Methylomonas sp.]PPD40046.1 MAG: LysR family transcriptional regulator [Methylomonas sp.]PPD41566.1 MAG: LysR family transcriptional regulator [Methylomonas sp.]
MDKLTSMNVFVRVAKVGSFAGAAKDLDISRAMATKHIMQLESELNTRLFNRTTRSLSLTEAGEEYLERCQQVLLDVKEMESAVTKLQTEPRGTLKICAPPVIGASHISPALTEYLKHHPDLSVEMVLKGGQVDLIDEGVDIAIYVGQLDDTSLVARKLATSSQVVCASPDYLKYNGIPQDPEDLESHSCLINWAIPPRNKWRFKGILGDRIVTVSGRLQANMSDPIRNAAVNGLGIIMLPRYIVDPDINEGRLQVIMEQYGTAPLEIHAVYPHRKYLSAKVRSFLEFMQGWLPGSIGMNPP